MLKLPLRKRTLIHATWTPTLLVKTCFRQRETRRCRLGTGIGRSYDLGEQRLEEVMEWGLQETPSGDAGGAYCNLEGGIGS